MTATRDDSHERAKALRTAEKKLRPLLSQPNGLLIDPHVQRTGEGQFSVHLRHHYRGVPLFLASTVVHVDGRSASVDGDGDRAAIDELDTIPVIAAREAVVIATAHLQGGPADSSVCDVLHAAVPPTARPRFRAIASLTGPTRPSIFARGPYREAPTGELTIHDKQLGWLVTVRTKILSEFLIVIGADAGCARRILFCRDISASACTAPIFLFDPGVPRETVDMPYALATYPAAFHTNAPISGFRWMDAKVTFGNNVETFWDSRRFTVSAMMNGGNLVFSPPLTPEKEQCVLNAFFFCNFMHDFFMLLGFSEADGAFHAVNVSGSGRPGDRLRLFLSPQLFPRLGVMRAHNDGDVPEMFLGRGPNGHAALEGAVVIHEYVHGVTQRMIGGVNNDRGVVLRQPQALAEAWSDFFGITIQNYYRNVQGLAENYVFARFSTNGSLRTRSYDGHVVTFGRAGSGPFRDPHNAGEIWAAAAIDFARRLGAQIGALDGYPIAWKCVFESFRRPFGNPTFLVARDALFNVIAQRPDSATILPLARESFRVRGMGSNARAPNPDDYRNNVENFDPWP